MKQLTLTFPQPAPPLPAGSPVMYEKKPATFCGRWETARMPEDDTFVIETPDGKERTVTMAELTRA